MPDINRQISQKRLALVKQANQWVKQWLQFGLSSAPLVKDSTCTLNVYLNRALTFVYPYGATLSVMKPAVAVLSTGSVCFPLNRPVLAFYQVKVRSSRWPPANTIQHDHTLFFKDTVCHLFTSCVNCYFFLSFRRQANWQWWGPATCSVTSTWTKRRTVK